MKVEPTDVAALVRGMNDLIERSIGTQIELAMNVPDDLPPVLVDANQIELAILNLVINARDAMPNGGQLTLELEEAELEDQDGPGASPGVRISVIDSGIGMDERTLERATEPFFSTKELGKGTGLGLSMIHGLARQLGGSLRLSSKLGRGTRAELWLPATTQTVSDHHAQQERGMATDEWAMTVLVVDDDVLISMSTALMVEDLGHKVVEVNSGSQALEVLRNNQHIDLLITDFSMPKMNGAELAKAAKEIRPDLPILLATGYADLPPETDADYPRIGKPYQQEQLAAAIAAVLSAQQSAFERQTAPEARL